MSKELNETDLAKIAKQTLEAYPHTEKVFATTDGNVFLDENRARLHAKKGRVIPFSRGTVFPVASETPEYRMNAKDTIDFIGKAEKEAIQEFANDSRKTVQAAYEKRMIELEDEPTELPPLDPLNGALEPNSPEMRGEDTNTNQEKE